MAALHRSVESLQAVVNMGPLPLDEPSQLQSLQGGKKSRRVEREDEPSQLQHSYGASQPAELPHSMSASFHKPSQLQHSYGASQSAGLQHSMSASFHSPATASFFVGTGASMPVHGSDSGSCSSREEAVCVHMDRHLQRLRKRWLLSGAWQSWSSHVHKAGLRAQLDMVIADERKIAKECNARSQGAAEALETEITEPTVAALKQLLLEFRQRLVAALADMLPSKSVESRALLVDTLDRGRCCFGRIFHASLFLYQKVRALVPTELLESVHDPLSKLVPFPFYVLPYKAQHALQRGLSALAHGVPTKARSRSSSPARAGTPNKGDAETREEWFNKRIFELEERLPLASSNKVEVPHFLARLLNCRAMAHVGAADARDLDDEAPLRDRFDVLLADAFTVYMSAWRTAGPSSPGSAALATLKPSSPYSVGHSAQTRQSSTPAFNLRLGVR